MKWVDLCGTMRNYLTAVGASDFHSSQSFIWSSTGHSCTEGSLKRPTTFCWLVVLCACSCQCVCSFSSSKNSSEWLLRERQTLAWWLPEMHCLSRPLSEGRDAINVYSRGCSLLPNCSPAPLHLFWFGAVPLPRLGPAQADKPKCFKND